MSQPIPQGFELKNKVLELQESILARHPRMPTLLKEIWVTMREQPENVTLLAEEDIKIIVNGLELQTQTHLASSIATKSKSSSSKALTSKLLKDDAL